RSRALMPGVSCDLLPFIKSHKRSINQYVLQTRLAAHLAILPGRFWRRPARRHAVATTLDRATRGEIPGHHSWHRSEQELPARPARTDLHESPIANCRSVERVGRFRAGA